jgi:hypothetical protein
MHHNDRRLSPSRMRKRPTRLGRRFAVPLAGVVAAAALGVPMAGQALAVPGTKQLHTQANTDRFLTMVDSFSVNFPLSKSFTNPLSQWFVEPFGVSLRIRNAGGDQNHCLKAGTSAGGVALARPCDASDPRQQWHLNGGALLANNGLRAEMFAVPNAPVPNAQAVRMVASLSVPPPPNQNWHVHDSIS